MHSEDRILVTHVGSLVRPPELVSWLLKEQAGEAIDETEFETVLANAVRDVVRRQVEAGIDLVSDGEYGKTMSWSRYILDRLEGMEERPSTTGVVSAIAGKDRADFKEFYEEYEASQGVAGLGKEARSFGVWTITGPISYKAKACNRDIDHLKAAVSETGGVTGFLPVVAPASVAPDRIDEYYDSEEEGLFAIADALHEEYKVIIDAGLVLQVDDAYMATTYDVMVPPKSVAEYLKWAELRVAALNRALDGLPEERIRYHMCWGSWNAPHTNDMALRDIVDLLLTVKAGCYSLEQANPRHEHEWQVWKDVKLPDGKVLLPGLITHSTNVVEHPELVSERIVRLAKLVGRENVIASTDCGFAQGPFTRRVHPSIMWAKLESLAEGARLASKELWGK